MKTVYLYDAVTGLPTSTYAAQESPLEKGVFITPVYSTEIEPPANIEGKQITFDGSVWQITDAAILAPTPINPNPTVEEIRARIAPLSAWQVRKVLTQFELRDSVEAAIVGADLATKDAWQHANDFERDNALLLSMAQALGLTDAQLDSMFQIGVTL